MGGAGENGAVVWWGWLGRIVVGVSGEIQVAEAAAEVGAVAAGFFEGYFVFFGEELGGFVVATSVF